MAETLSTPRLILRRFTLDDAPFMLQLVNDPAWLRFIGDRHVHTVAEAEAYLQKGPIASYQAHGFGFSCVILKDTGVPIGMCGLTRRDFLDHPDLGFAFLPGYTGKGYAFEITSATVNHARVTLGLNTLLAFAASDNERSIHLLDKLGYRYKGPLVLEGEELSLFSLDL